MPRRRHPGASPDALGRLDARLADQDADASGRPLVAATVRAIATNQVVPTQYGFVWGVLSVSRAAVLPNGALVLLVHTPRRQMSLYISPTGLIRVFTDPGDEWRPTGRKERHGRANS